MNDVEIIENVNEVPPRTLRAMHLYGTRYEVVARHEDGSEHRLGFTAKRTKRALLSIAQANGPMILDWLGDWDGLATYRKDFGWKFGPVAIAFSGRTERDVANQGS